MAAEMTREQIEQMARGIARSAHCRFCDRLQDPHPLYDRKCRADVEDSAQEIIACVEKATAELRKEVEDLKHDIDRYIDIAAAEATRAEQVDRRAREDCARIAEDEGRKKEYGPYGGFWTDCCGETVAQAIRATIKEQPK